MATPRDVQESPARNPSPASNSSASMRINTGKGFGGGPKSWTGFSEEMEEEVVCRSPDEGFWENFQGARGWAQGVRAKGSLSERTDSGKSGTVNQSQPKSTLALVPGVATSSPPNKATPSCAEPDMNEIGIWAPPPEEEVKDAEELQEGSEKSVDRGREAMEAGVAEALLDEYFWGVVERLLEKEGLGGAEGSFAQPGMGGEEGKPDWLTLVMALVLEAIDAIRPEREMPPGWGAGAMRIQDYVKVKCVACGAPSQSYVVQGLVCRKNVADRHMATQYKEPRLLLLGGHLDHHGAHLPSIETLIVQDLTSGILLAEINRLKPNVLLVEKTVSRLSQGELLKAGISLAFNVKRSLLDRIALYTGTEVASSPQACKKVGTCKQFYTREIPMPGYTDAGKKKKSKPLMFFEGCPFSLACSVILHGPDLDELKKVKRAVKQAIVAAYHLVLELSFWIDEGGSVPALILTGKEGATSGGRMLLEKTKLEGGQRVSGRIAGSVGSAALAIGHGRSEAGEPGLEGSASVNGFEDFRRGSREGAGSGTAVGSGGEGSEEGRGGGEWGGQDGGEGMRGARGLTLKCAAHMLRSVHEASLVNRQTGETMAAVDVDSQSWKQGCAQGARLGLGSRSKDELVGSRVDTGQVGFHIETEKGGGGGGVTGNGGAESGQRLLFSLEAKAEEDTDECKGGMARITSGVAEWNLDQACGGRQRPELTLDRARPLCPEASWGTTAKAKFVSEGSAEEVESTGLTGPLQPTESVPSNAPNAVLDPLARASSHARTGTTVGHPDLAPRQGLPMISSEHSEHPSGQIFDSIAQTSYPVPSPSAPNQPPPCPPSPLRNPSLWPIQFRDPIPPLPRRPHPREANGQSYPSDWFPRPGSDRNLELLLALGLRCPSPSPLGTPTPTPPLTPPLSPKQMGTPRVGSPMDESVWQDGWSSAEGQGGGSGGSGKLQAQLMADDETILVWLSSRNLVKDRLCKEPQLRRMQMYGTRDETLGTFLHDYVLNPECKCDVCGEPKQTHVRTYTHYEGMMTVTVKELPASQELPGGPEGKIWMWHRCLQCPLQDGRPPATRCVLMSPATWGLSLAKFFELSFLNPEAASQRAPCGHSLHRGCLRFFGKGRLVACMRQSPITVRAVCLPPAQLQFNHPEQQQWLLDEFQDVAAKERQVFAEVGTRLWHTVEGPSSSASVDTRQHVAELERLLQDEQADFASKLQEAAPVPPNDHRRIADILEINRLRQDLATISAAWDHRLGLLSVETKKGSLPGRTASSPSLMKRSSSGTMLEYLVGRYFSDGKGEGETGKEEVEAEGVGREGRGGGGGGGGGEGSGGEGEGEGAGTREREAGVERRDGKGGTEEGKAVAGLEVGLGLGLEQGGDGDGKGEAEMTAEGKKGRRDERWDGTEEAAKTGKGGEEGRVLETGELRGKSDLGGELETGEEVGGMGKGRDAEEEMSSRNGANDELSARRAISVGSLPVFADLSDPSVCGKDQVVGVERLHVGPTRQLEDEETVTQHVPAQVALSPRATADADVASHGVMETGPERGGRLASAAGASWRSEGARLAGRAIGAVGGAEAATADATGQASGGRTGAARGDMTGGISATPRLIEELSLRSGLSVKLTMAADEDKREEEPGVPAGSFAFPVGLQGQPSRQIRTDIPAEKEAVGTAERLLEVPSGEAMSRQHLVVDRSADGVRSGETEAREREARERLGLGLRAKGSPAGGEEVEGRKGFEPHGDGKGKAGLEGALQNGTSIPSKTSIPRDGIAWQETAKELPKKGRLREGGSGFSDWGLGSLLGSAAGKKKGQPAAAAQQSLPPYADAEEIVVHEGTHLRLPPCADDSVIIVYDEEPTSIIAYAISSVDYRRAVHGETRWHHQEGKKKAGPWPPVLRDANATRDEKGHGGKERTMGGGGEGTLESGGVGDRTIYGKKVDGREPMAGSENREGAGTHGKQSEPESRECPLGLEKGLVGKRDARAEGVGTTGAADRRQLEEGGTAASGGSPSEEEEDFLLTADQMDVKVYFTDNPNEGTGGTASKPKTEFWVTSYFAAQFDALRQKCCGGPEGTAEFVRSLCRCRKWEAQGGKSEVYFAKTRDDRFVIKEVTQTEKVSLFNFAPKYFKYLSDAYRSGNPTGLAKLLGFFEVTVKKAGKKTTTNLVVSENLFYGRHVSRVYDLKGSLRSRLNKEPEKNKVLLDENLVLEKATVPIFVADKAKALLERAVWNDSGFLESVGVMDYSLLVGIVEDSQELVVGIIDYCRRYTWDKHLETWVKASGILGGPPKTMPTVISPEDYKKRFRSAITKYFVRVKLPEQAEGPSAKAKGVSLPPPGGLKLKLEEQTGAAKGSVALKSMEGGEEGLRREGSEGLSVGAGSDGNGSGRSLTGPRAEGPQRGGEEGAGERAVSGSGSAFASNGGVREEQGGERAWE